MSAESSEKSAVAREALANIRRLLKRDTAPLPRQEDTLEIFPVEARDNPNRPYTGTIDDLIYSIESAAIKHDNSVESWSARTLMLILGYGLTAWDDFKGVILKAQYACERSDKRIDEHFSAIIKTDASDDMDDIKVTRYGAYLIAQNGDARKKQVAYAQTYFATQTRRQQLQDSDKKSTRDELRRLEMRDKIAEHNKALAEAAKSAGIEAGADFARFQNFGYKGLYNGLDMRGIRDAKKLAPTAKILDHMDITELAANFFRATQAEDKLRREQIIGKEKANAAHYEVGMKVRKAIKDIGGAMPERLPPAEHIDNVRKRVAKLEGKD